MTLRSPLRVAVLVGAALGVGRAAAAADDRRATFVDPAALDGHFAAYVEPLLRAAGPAVHAGSGLTTLHFDRWQMSSQNGSGAFRQAFRDRRGYGPVRYLPVMTGRTVGSAAVLARFLWDLRQTAGYLMLRHT